jgi:hypothetical protein
MEKKTWTARGELTENDKDIIMFLSEEKLMASRIFLSGEVHKDTVGELEVEAYEKVNLGMEKDFHQAPLFEYTSDLTWRMTRFNPREVWPFIKKGLLADLSDAELRRLGLQVSVDLRGYDFYEAMIAAIKANLAKQSDSTLFMPQFELVMYDLELEDRGFEEPTDMTMKLSPQSHVHQFSRGTSNLNTEPILNRMSIFYNIMYLASLMLLGKPGYMAVDVARHFALPEAAVFMERVHYRTLTGAEEKQVRELREKYQDIACLTNTELACIYQLYKANTEK